MVIPGSPADAPGYLHINDSIPLLFPVNGFPSLSRVCFHRQLPASPTVFALEIGPALPYEHLCKQVRTGPFSLLFTRLKVCKLFSEYL